MSAGVLSIVLFAAFLHALWNAVVKGAGDKSVILALVALGNVLPGIAMVVMSPAPALAAWPYIIGSTVIHWGYYYLLALAYRLGDLSAIYPIARGMAPVLIAFGAQFWIGEMLPWQAWLGLIVISIGIMVITGNTMRSGVPLVGLLAAVGVSITIAAYSVTDGIGVRASNSPIGYIGWLFILELTVVGYIFTTSWQRVRETPPKVLVLGFLAGVISSAAYGLVLYAKTLAPLGAVSAIRETSVIFAALIGVLWFKEGPRLNRFVAAVIVAAGIIFIATGD